MIPMVDLAAADPALQREIEEGFRKVMASGRFVLGPNVQAFETEVAAHLGVAQAVTCASGTDALHLALRALGVGPGDEVITSPFSFFGTVEAVRQVGAVPVFADIDGATFNLDPQRVAEALSSATRAILPVHLFGQPAALEPLRALAGRHRLWLIEDCAQAFGAARGGHAVGTLGHAGCFSFYPSKNLGGYGDGGMVTTGSRDLAERLRALRNHGSVQPPLHQSIGLNSRLDELQAVVLRAKLKRVDERNLQRRRVARAYAERLSRLPAVQTPWEDPGGVHVYHQYTLQVNARDAVRRALASRGVASAVHYPVPLHRQPALADAYREQRFPVAEAVAQRCLSLPMYPELDDLRIDFVAATLEEALAAG